MKLLLDENLSPRLISMLSDICADSNHISWVGLASSDDSAIWDYAN
jgi:predicted nuclease of predicted toxin-antitoxin system